MIKLFEENSYIQEFETQIINVDIEKNLIELEKMVKSGFRAVMLFLICRNDCEVFDISDDLDPFYAKCFSKAYEAGVEVLCYDTVINKEIIKIGRRIPLCDALINRMSFNDAG